MFGLKLIIIFLHWNFYFCYWRNQVDFLIKNKNITFILKDNLNNLQCILKFPSLLVVLTRTFVTFHLILYFSSNFDFF